MYFRSSKFKNKLKKFEDISPINLTDPQYFHFSKTRFKISVIGYLIYEIVFDLETILLSLA
jgi:hypothetical protein